MLAFNWLFMNFRINFCNLLLFYWNCVNYQTIRLMDNYSVEYSDIKVQYQLHVSQSSSALS